MSIISRGKNPGTENEEDAFSVKKVFEDIKITNQLVRKIGGEDALKYLEDN